MHGPYRFNRLCLLQINIQSADFDENGHYYYIFVSIQRDFEHLVVLRHTVNNCREPKGIRDSFMYDSRFMNPQSKQIRQ